MSRVFLTPALIRKLRPGETVQDAAVPGMLVQGGVRGATFRLRCRLASGQQVSVRLGRSPAMTLDAARMASRIALEAAASGADPRTMNFNVADITLHDVLRRWWHQTPAARRTTAQQKQIRAAEIHVPELLGKRLVALEGREMDAAITAIAVRGHQPTARVVALVLRRACAWAHANGIVPLNPAHELEPPDATGRDRVPSLAEMRALWAASASWPATDRRFVRVLMLAGSRRGETAEMRVGDLDGDLWTIPSTAAKNATALTVPLPAAAMAEIREALAGRSLTPRDRVLTNGAGGPLDDTDMKRINRLLGTISPAAPFRMHDLRRAIATDAMMQGWSKEILDATLNHSRAATMNAVDRVYLRTRVLEQRRRLHAEWAERVTGEVQVQNQVQNGKVQA